MKKRLLLLVLCLQIVVASLAGCSSKKDETGKGVTETTAKIEADSGKGIEDIELIDPRESGLSDIFPLEEKITFTYYIKQNDAMASTMETYADVEFFKELEELTNVHIEWNHNASDEGFALMIQSGEYPDLINWPLNNVPGGVGTLLEDDVIIDLTNLIPVHAPNYYAWLQANPEEDKASLLDDGTRYQFTSFTGDWETLDMVYYNISGPQIRQDWLDKLGLKMPTTTDELYDVLVAFKNNDMNGNGDANDEIPYVITGGGGLSESMYSLAGSFGTRQNFHTQDGKVVYGPMTDNYKEFLLYMNKLYTEGLINTDFAINEDAFSLIIQDRGGFTFGAMGSGVIAAHELLLEKNPSYNYVSVPWLKGPEGYQSARSDKGGVGRTTAISTQCEYPEIALAWLDYAYTYAGSVNSSFGIEGKSYDVIDGYPTIREEVKVNDKGWTEEESMCRWMLGSINYPNARDFRFYEQINLNEPYKMDIQENWGLADDKINLPPVILTAEESEKFSGIMSDVSTHVNEYSLRFIVGEVDIETEWDRYVETIEKLNIEEARLIQEAAVERYNAR